MSDPHDPLSRLPPPTRLDRAHNRGEVSKESYDQEFVGGAVGLIAGLLLTGRYHAASHLIELGTFIKVPPQVRVPRPNLAMSLVLDAPPPFGFGSSYDWRLRKNWLRHTLEEDIGVPGEMIPASKLFATEKDTPQFEADYTAKMNRVVVAEYRSKIYQLSFEQQQADYNLFVRAARGELGPVPSNLPVAQLAAALKAENEINAKFTAGTVGTIRTVIVGQPGRLIEPPPAPPPNSTTTVRPVVSVGGGGDYGAGGGDPLKPTTNPTTKVVGNTTDPLQAVAQVADNNQLIPGVPNALLQEAMRRAPELLRNLLTERTDP